MVLPEFIAAFPEGRKAAAYFRVQIVFARFNAQTHLGLCFLRFFGMLNGTVVIATVILFAIWLVSEYIIRRSA